MLTSSPNEEISMGRLAKTLLTTLTLLLAFAVMVALLSLFHRVLLGI